MGTWRRLTAFADVIRRRPEAYLQFLRAPHTRDEIEEHRFVYRPPVGLSPLPSGAPPNCTWTGSPGTGRWCWGTTAGTT